MKNDLVYAWKNAMTQKYGDPDDKSKNGFIFKVEEFIIEDETHSLTVTLYIYPSGDKKSKLHINVDK